MLKTYVVDIIEQELIEERKGELEDRSIFKYGDKYIDYFDSVKEFIQKHQKKGNLISLPENNIEVLLGFDRSSRTFFTYDIFKKRISKQFKL